MEAKSAILNEVKQISPAVAEVGFGLPYQVPTGYFEGLADVIMNRIKTESLSAAEELQMLSPLLSGLNKTNPYSVPDGYFSGISPVLSGLRNTNVYQVPQGYFENLAGNILDRVTEKQPAKVISMNPVRRMVRYAAAAAIIGVIAIAGWLYFNNGGSSANIQPIAAVAVDTLSNDNKVTDEEMASYLETGSSSIAANTSISVDEDADMDAADVKELLSDVSDDELKDYLITL